MLRALSLVLSLVVLPLTPAAMADAGREARVDAAVWGEIASRGAAIGILQFEPAKEQSALGALERLGIEHHRYEALHQAAAVLTGDALAELARTEGIRAIDPNEIMTPALDKAAPYVGADVLWSTYALDGEGATIFVVDTGIDGLHPDLRFGSKLVQNVLTTRTATGLVSASVENVPSSDLDGHGTHVASIAAGAGVALGELDPESGRYKGIAFGADIVGFQAGILTAEERVVFESVVVLEAFNYALEHRAELGIRVVTNSWGVPGAFDPKGPIAQATLSLYRAGLVVLFAAGNDGEDGDGTLNKHCVAPWVLCVAAGDYANRRAPFSSMGTNPDVSGLEYDHPDLMAPGVAVRAARAITGVGATVGSAGDPLALPGEFAEALYTTKSGTSMATPVVAGAAALLLSANPNLSPDEVYDVLVSTATPVDQPTWEAGAGYLNLLSAYREAEKLPGTLGTFLDGSVKYGGDGTGDPDNSEDPVTVGLGRGEARPFSGSDVSPLDFLEMLFTTPQGLVFVAATAALGLLSFARRRP